MSKLRTSQTLADILADTAKEIAEDKLREPLTVLKTKIRQAPKSISFHRALRQPGYGIIGEIKECSPSKGAMNPENVKRAAEVYQRSQYVRAISVLTNRTHFGKSMTLGHLLEVKKRTGKPILRKDFILDEYQIYQAKAYGADAILLMANILKLQELKRFHHIAKTLGLDVLFETHEPGELRKIPAGANIYGINSRNFCSDKVSFTRSRLLGCLRLFKFGRTDLTTDFNRFSYCDRLPHDAVKVAESGVGASDCAQVFDQGFNAILVGTALLWGPQRIDDSLEIFEREIHKLEQNADREHMETAPLIHQAEPVHA